MRPDHYEYHRCGLPPRLASYQRRLQRAALPSRIRAAAWAWLMGSGCRYRPLDGLQGYHCVDCGQAEWAHRSLPGRILSHIGLVP